MQVLWVMSECQRRVSVRFLQAALMEQGTGASRDDELKDERSQARWQGDQQDEEGKVLEVEQEHGSEQAR